jgi:hypothetical protein
VSGAFATGQDGTTLPQPAPTGGDRRRGNGLFQRRACSAEIGEPPNTQAEATIAPATKAWPGMFLIAAPFLDNNDFFYLPAVVR